MLADAFAAYGIVALSWAGIRGLGDLRGLRKSEIVRLMKASQVSVPGADTAELLNFLDDVEVGDIVVTPDAISREVLIGEVIGEYDHRDPSPAGDSRHIQDMRRYGRLQRDHLPVSPACRYELA